MGRGCPGCPSPTRKPRCARGTSRRCSRRPRTSRAGGPRSPCRGRSSRCRFCGRPCARGRWPERSTRSSRAPRFATAGCSRRWTASSITSPPLRKVRPPAGTIPAPACPRSASPSPPPPSPPPSSNASHTKVPPPPREAPPPGGAPPPPGAPPPQKPVPSAPFSALVFKVLQEEARRTVYLRVYSGKVEEGDTLLNAAAGMKEKVARLFRMHAGKKERIAGAAAGDIVAARGIRFARTGDTLCDPEAPIVFESIEIRKPVVSVVVEPKTVREMDRLRELLCTIMDEDPTLSFREDADTGQILLSGMGELHLEIAIDRLAREHGMEVRKGTPQVVYRETVATEGVAESVFERDVAERPVKVVTV